MNKWLLLLALTPMAFADPAVDNVQVNIHNESQHSIDFISFDSNRVFINTHIDEQRIAPYTMKYNVIRFNSFDKGPISAGVEVLINGEPMKLMWQINMGINKPDAPKSHMCGVVKQNDPHIYREYCDIPYVDSGTLIVDFHID